MAFTRRACSRGIPVITSAASPERPWPGITSRRGSAPRPPSRWRSGWPAFGRGSLLHRAAARSSGSPRRSSLYLISRPVRSRSLDLSAGRRRFLRGVARRTWRYFTDFASEGGWLAPDNMQEVPTETIARRTSPTNLGMALLSNLAAYDFGYISAASLLRRTENAMTAMESLSDFGATSTTGTTPSRCSR